MRAVRDGASRTGKSRLTLLESRMATIRRFYQQRARGDLKQLCYYINPDFSVKMSDVSEYSDIEILPGEKKKKEKRCGRIIKMLID